MRDLVIPFLIAGAWLTVMAVVVAACRSAAGADRDRTAASAARPAHARRTIPARGGHSAGLT